MTSRMFPRSVLAVALLAAATSAPPAHANSPWLPAAGTHQSAFSIVVQEADELYVGDVEMPLPTTLEQQSYVFDYSYGINDRLALDLRAGWAESDFLVDPGLAPEGGLDGFTDARVGLRWNWLDGLGDAPFTLTLSAAALIEGDYEVGALPAIGDGASGAELSVLSGWAFASGFAWQSEIGYRYRSGEVPNEWFFNRTLSYSFNDRVAARVGWYGVESRGDLDIGGTGFTPARFPEVEEDYELWLLGASVGLGEDFTLGLDYGRKFDGRNTARSEVLLVNLAYAW